MVSQSVRNRIPGLQKENGFRETITSTTGPTRSLIYIPLCHSRRSIVAVEHPGHVRHCEDSRMINVYTSSVRPTSLEILWERPPIGADG